MVIGTSTRLSSPAPLLSSTPITLKTFWLMRTVSPIGMRLPYNVSAICEPSTTTREPFNTCAGVILIPTFTVKFLTSR